MRYESKHKQMKLISTVISNTQNVPKSICIKNQLRTEELQNSKCYLMNASTYNTYEAIDIEDLRKYFPKETHPQKILSTKSLF